MFTHSGRDVLLLNLLQPRSASAGQVVYTAHPAKFSPDDKYAPQRVQVKKRFNILPTQQPLPEMSAPHGRAAPQQGPVAAAGIQRHEQGRELEGAVRRQVVASLQEECRPSDRRLVREQMICSFSRGGALPGPALRCRETSPAHLVPAPRVTWRT